MRQIFVAVATPDNGSPALGFGAPGVTTLSVHPVGERLIEDVLELLTLGSSQTVHLGEELETGLR